MEEISFHGRSRRRNAADRRVSELTAIQFEDGMILGFSPFHSIFFVFGEVMKRKYESEGDILAVVKSFEDGTISRDDWRHAEHLTVALYYLSRHDLETAIEKMRGGIF